MRKRRGEKHETGSLQGFCHCILAQTFKLAAWAAEIGAPRRRGEIWRDQIVIFMFSARAGNISLAPIHFPPYLSALIPETPPDCARPLQSRFHGSDHPPDLLSSSLPLLLSRCDLHSPPPGEGFVGPIALRTIKIAGHVAKCPDDPDRVRVAHHRNQLSV